MKQIDTEMYILFTVLQLTPVTDTDTHKCIAMYSILLLYNRGTITTEVEEGKGGAHDSAWLVVRPISIHGSVAKTIEGKNFIDSSYVDSSLKIAKTEEEGGPTCGSLALNSSDGQFCEDEFDNLWNSEQRRHPLLRAV